MTLTEAPYQFYTDKDGKPLDDGRIYFGLPNQNPQTAPIPVYWDAAGTQPAAQPIRTLNGYPVRPGASGTPANVYVGRGYSTTVLNKKGEIVYYAPDVTINLDLITVENWGAVGDGVADDTAAIQLAINIIQDKGPILLTAGKTYKITQPLLCPYRVNISSTSVVSVVGTATIDGSALPAAEFCIYLQRPYSAVKGITFLGNSRTRSAINAGASVPTVAHASTIERCNFVDCLIDISANFSCDVLVDRCYFNAGGTAAVLDNTANTWEFRDCLFFNFVAATSTSIIYAKSADQVAINSCWFELNSVPVVLGERYTNIHITDSWIEHLVVGNTSPLFVVNGNTVVNPYNFVIDNSDVITNWPTFASLTNVQNFELRDVRMAGMNTPNVFPFIECTNVDLVKMESVYCEYNSNPPTQSNRIVVNGATRVIRDDLDSDLVPKIYSNQVWDSSFKGITNVVTSGDVAVTQETLVGVHDTNSLKIAFGALGTGLARTNNNIPLVGGQWVRMSAWMWTDSTALFNQVIMRIAGPTSGKNRIVPLTRTPRRVDLIWQVPASGFDGNYFAFFNYSIHTGALRAYNVWVEDVQIVVDSDPIPYIPYVMNNSLSASVEIGMGVNLTEHTLMGRKVSSGTAAPTTGAWRKNAIVYNDNATAGGFIGWVCTASGTPGTWKTFGAISP